MDRALALACLLALSACREDPQAALLAGAWLCAAEPQDYAMERQVTYGADGTLSGRTQVESTDDQTPVAMQLTFAGTWSVSDGTLTEELDTHRLMRFARDGQNVPLAELPAGFITEIESTLAGQAARYGIVTVSAEELVLRDALEGVETVCERVEEGG